MTEPDAVLDPVFGALMHPTRRDMLIRLTERDLSVGELAAPLPVSLAAASKHVQVLERAGLIERTVLGRRHEFRVRTAGLVAAARWLDGALVAPAPPAAGVVQTAEDGVDSLLVADPEPAVAAEPSDGAAPPSGRQSATSPEPPKTPKNKAPKAKTKGTKAAAGKAAADKATPITTIDVKTKGAKNRKKADGKTAKGKKRAKKSKHKS